MITNTRSGNLAAPSAVRTPARAAFGLCALAAVAALAACGGGDGEGALRTVLGASGQHRAAEADALVAQPAQLAWEGMAEPRLLKLAPLASGGHALAWLAPLPGVPTEWMPMLSLHDARGQPLSAPVALPPALSDPNMRVEISPDGRVTRLDLPAPEPAEPWGALPSVQVGLADGSSVTLAAGPEPRRWSGRVLDANGAPRGEGFTVNASSLPMVTALSAPAAFAIAFVSADASGGLQLQSRRYELVSNR